MSRFSSRLLDCSRRNDSLLCVGLDVDPARIPEPLKGRGDWIYEYNLGLIEATADLVCAYKPNLGFYEALGAEGLDALARTVRAVPNGIPVIGDAKRGDIGHTATAYARALFEVFGFDAVTVNPYLGMDTVEPFLAYEDRGVFLLCKTSNPGSGDFQDLICETPDGRVPLYQVVAQRAATVKAPDDGGPGGGRHLPHGVGEGAGDRPAGAAPDTGDRRPGRRPGEDRTPRYRCGW